MYYEFKKTNTKKEKVKEHIKGGEKVHFTRNDSNKIRKNRNENDDGTSPRHGKRIP